MNGTRHLMDARLDDYGRGWSTFARWMTGSVLIVVVSLALTFLGPWARHAILRGGGASVPTVLGVNLVSAALIACGIAMAWTYFTRVRHSATWLVRLWLFAFTFCFLLSSTEVLPLWFSLVGLVAWPCFLWWTRRAWGINDFETDRSNKETVDA